jgi:hypothetical protein
VSKIVLHAAAAQQMRWNTAHQNLSRAWRKLCEGGLSAYGVEWRSAHRFIRDPPPLPLWAAAREYLDACSGRGAYGGPAFEAWTEAHEAHNASFNESKKRGARAAQLWRAFAVELDASGVRPCALFGPLVQRCGELGIDRWVVPAKLRKEERWTSLLTEAPRPTQTERAAWRALLRENPFGAGAGAVFREVERESVRADAANLDVEAAYRRMLDAAASRSEAGVRAKDEFWRLLEAARWK